MNDQLRIEIAGLGGEIRGPEAKLPPALRRDLEPFRSECEADFVIEVRDPQVEQGGMVVPDATYREGVEEVKFEEDHGLIRVHCIIPPRVEIGSVELDRRKCTFYGHSPAFTNYFLLPFVRFAFQLFLAERGGILMHSCGVVWRKHAYLFLGSSGAGKTTVAGLSRGRTVISDEYTCVRADGASPRLYGTPWRGGVNLSGKLRGVFLLEKGNDLEFSPLSQAQAVAAFHTGLCTYPPGQRLREQVLDDALRMAERVPCYRMRFSLDSPIWEGIERLFN